MIAALLLALALPANTWVRLAHDGEGARRASAVRHTRDGFLLWGFQGHLTDDYGTPEKPWTGNREYDMVAFDPARGSWANHLPLARQAEWSRKLPPMHECASYQGITTGSYRPQLKEREGVPRPDLNIVFDQVTYDTRRQRLVYFTGGRTLAYDVARREWTDAAGDSPAPPPVSAGSLAYDPVNDELVLAGGGHVAERGPDGKLAGYTGTWIFACASGRWRRLEGAVEPRPRMNSRLVYDARSRKMVLFGGDGQSRYLADTWLYDVATRQWKASRAQGGPPARGGHFTVYDPRTGWVIIGGGYNREDLDDLWAFDAAAERWRKLPGAVPKAWYITADLDPSTSTIVLVASSKTPGDRSGCNEIYPVRTTYAFRVERAGLVDAAARVSRQADVWKRSREESLAGTGPDAARAKRQAAVLAGMEPNRWVLLDHPGRPGALRTWGSCTIDTDTSRLIYWGGDHCGYGGSDYDLYDVAQNTWIASPVEAEYPERAWDRGVNPAGVTFSGVPWVRHGRKVYAWDPVSKLIINTKTILLTAGYRPELLRDVAGEEAPGASSYRKWVTMSYDPAGERWDLVCSGAPGLDLVVSTPHGVMGVDHFWDRVAQKTREHLPNSVYLLDVAGRRWKKLPNAGPWPENVYETAALVYDSRRDRLLLHGAGKRRDELWSYALQAGRWERLEPGGDPAPVAQREAVYLPRYDTVLTASAGSLWAYHAGENRWEKLRFPPPPGRDARELNSQNRAWAYDPRHDLVLMVLGEGRGDLGEARVYGLRYQGDIIASSR